MHGVSETRRQGLLAAAGALVGVVAFAAYIWYRTPSAPPQAPVPTVAAPLATAAVAGSAAMVEPLQRSAIPQAPFGFVGAVAGEDGRPRYMFSRGDQTYPVAVGEAIANEYRLDGVDDNVASLTRLSDGAAAIVTLGGGPGSGSLGLDAVHEEGQSATTRSARVVAQRVREAHGKASRR